MERPNQGIGGVGRDCAAACVIVYTFPDIYPCDICIINALLLQASQSSSHGGTVLYKFALQINKI